MSKKTAKSSTKPLKFQVGDEVEMTIRCRGIVKGYGPVWDSYEVAWGGEAQPPDPDRIYYPSELRRADP